MLKHFPEDVVWDSEGDQVMVACSAMTGERWGGSVEVVPVEQSGKKQPWSCDMPHGAVGVLPPSSSSPGVFWVASSSASLLVFDGPRLLHRLAGHDASLSGLVRLSSPSNNPSRLLTSSLDSTSRLWDPESLSCVAVLEAHVAPVDLTAAHPSDGSFATYSSHDRSLLLWASQDHSSPALSFLTPSEATALSFGPSGSHALFVGLANGAASRYDVRKLADGPLDTRTIHRNAVRRFAFGPDGKICTGSDDCTARLWDSDVVVTHGDFVRGVLFVDEGRKLLTAGWDKVLKTTAL